METLHKKSSRLHSIFLTKYAQQSQKPPYLHSAQSDILPNQTAHPRMWALPEASFSVVPLPRPPSLLAVLPSLSGAVVLLPHLLWSQQVEACTFGLLDDPENKRHLMRQWNRKINHHCQLLASCLQGRSALWDAWQPGQSDCCTIGSPHVSPFVVCQPDGNAIIMKGISMVAGLDNVVLATAFKHRFGISADLGSCSFIRLLQLCVWRATRLSIWVRQWHLLIICVFFWHCGWRLLSHLLRAQAQPEVKNKEKRLKKAAAEKLCRLISFKKKWNCICW